MRHEFYISAVAIVLAELPAEHRREAWADLEQQFLEEYKREHPTARAEAANEAFLDLATDISLRIANAAPRRPKLRLPRG
jgi:hypothetical protein